MAEDPNQRLLERIAARVSDWGKLDRNWAMDVSIEVSGSTIAGYLSDATRSRWGGS
jgi:hypothetical protein